ncbi:MAG: MarR family transcriptional regulator [Candidatus Undinarchaeales archaeon]|nr:MarR family transcriptional regulator [Candidatus Undinarchaeales archaeon]MDP7493579.1 MarR family transcriptional regulator [Candidatus Undinarchaeales archaeon]
MRYRHIVLMVALAFLVAVPGLGVRVTDYNVTFDIEASPLETIVLDIVNDEAEPLAMLSYELDKLPESLTVERAEGDGFAPERFQTEQLETGARVDIDLAEPVPPGGSARLRLSFTDPSIIQDLEEEVLFKFTLQPSVHLERFTLYLLLPSGAGVSGSSTLPLSPKPDNILTDGRRVYVVWTRDDVAVGEGLSFFALYRFYGSGPGVGPAAVRGFAADTPPPGDSGTSVLIGFMLGAALVGTYHLRSRIRHHQETGELITAVVTEDENQVLAAIKDNGGEMRQDEMGEMVGFSKPKLSKVVRRLEEKGLVDKTPHHKTNILTRVKR